MSRLFFGISILILCLLPSVNASEPTQPLKAETFQCSREQDGRFLMKGTVSLCRDGSLYFEIEAHDFENITMAHLHIGREGEIGSPVFWLYPDRPPPKLIPGFFKGVLARGEIMEKDLIGPMRGKSLDSLISELRRGNIYLNIHTKTHARGDFCGPMELME